jgi:2-deoxy-D-gluconate 3-dehydrogenase
LTKKILHDSHDIDILVTCAGIQRRHSSHLFLKKDWDEVSYLQSQNPLRTTHADQTESQVLQVNLSTVFTLCRDIGAYMLTRPGPHRGSIINVASLVSFQGGLTVRAYAAAMGGVAQLTKALSNEWASKGINVNAIALGYVATDMNEALIKDKERAAGILARITMGRWGNPDDFKGPVIFLASKASAYVSGAIFIVEGGWTGR